MTEIAGNLCVSIKSNKTRKLCKKLSVFIQNAIVTFQEKQIEKKIIVVTEKLFN